MTQGIDAAVRRPGLLKDPRLQRWGFQGLIIALLVLLAVLAMGNLEGNLKQRGLSFGFDFLRQESGFEIAFSLLPYRASDTYWRVFLVGLTNTLLVTVLVMLLSTILGFMIGIARLSKSWALSRATLLYVEIVRNLPQLLHIMLWYNVALRNMPAPRQAGSFFDVIFFTNRGIYIPALKTEYPLLWIGAVLISIIASISVCVAITRRSDAVGRPLNAWLPSLVALLLLPISLFFATGDSLSVSMPQLKGFNFTGGWVFVPELSALVFAMTIYNAAFIGELVRASILAVNRGQREAAFAIGFNWLQTLRYIVIPQALRVLIPPLGNQYLNILKGSSLAVAIGFPDLVSVFTGITMNQTGRAIEIVLMTMATYMLIGVAISMCLNLFNSMTRIIER
ncbi:ABC transporter permease subunit [Bordetella petrii]|nr:ABC transporter permease subunit [Bordetella petrii]